MKAAGRSLPKAAASRARKARPPSVPTTAPATPTTAPESSEPPAAVSAAPQSPPIKIRVPNWTGTVRLGVEGSWSLISSPIAASVKTHGVQAYPRNASPVPESGSRPI